MTNLVELYDLVIQAQALNGVPLSHGHVYVYALGRTTLMDTWSDIDGESLNTNPVILDNAGQAHIYVSDDFDYTLVFTDEFDNEIFSVDKYLLSKGEHSHADVAVAPSEHIGVSSYHVGEVTVYVPYLTGEVGKVYEGIDPIVVNNDVNRISANHIPLGVQDPLYFVEDSETACIIGFSGETIPEGVMSESALGFENNKITGYNGSAFSAGNEYEAGSYVDIDNNTIYITGLQPEGDYAYNSALSSKLDVTALPQDLVHSGELTAYYPTSNPSGFITGVDLTDYATTAQLDEKLDKSDSGNFYPMTGNPSGFLTAHQSLQGYATEQWVEGKGYITGVDIPESATWNATTQTVSANSAQWGASNPQIPVTGINGIKISESGDKVVFEVSGDYYPGNNPSGFITGVDLSDYATTAQVSEKQDSLTFGYKDTAISSIDNSALYDNSAHARITTLAGRISDLSSNKLDTTAFSDVSGTFITAHQDLSDYQTTAGMTAYQEVGDYYSASNPSGFITGVDLTPYQTIEGMTAYQPVGDYATNTELQTVSGEITAMIPTALTGEYLDKASADTLYYPLESNPSGYLTAHQSLDGYATITDVESGLSGKEDVLTFTYTGNAISTINGSAIAGESIPFDVYGISASANIELVEEDNTLWISGRDWSEDLTAKQDKLTFGYNASNAISSINNSAIAGEGGGGGGVSGTNVVFVPEYEGAEFGRYYSATISGDIVVTTGDYNEYDISPGYEYSLISIASNLGNKLDKSTVNDSNTLINYEGHTEVFEKAYRATGFFNGSAENVSLSTDVLSVNFVSDDIEPETHLYSAIVTIETTTTGDVPEDWKLISYENNSAILTKIFPLNEMIDGINLSNYDGWNITNCDASATVYSALEIAPLAFKDEIASTANLSAELNELKNIISTYSGQWVSP